jgi:hypothetical protein
MLEERTMHLINASLDGELTPAETAELDAILESSSEAREIQTEFQRLTNLLDSVPAQEPPQALSQRILNQIAPPKKAAFSLAGLFKSFQPATAGLAFAAGLLATVAVYEMTPGHDSTTDTTGMVGTMVAGQQDRTINEVDRLSVAETGLSGSVSLRENGSVYVIEIDLESEAATEIEIAFAEAGLSFGGIAHALPGGKTTNESFEVSGGTLRVENNGVQAFTIFLPDAASHGGNGREISIGISTGGAQVFAGVLRG